VPTALSCEGQESWQHGNSLVNYMKWLEMEGLTGRIRFDSLGRRTDFELEIVELKKTGLEKVRTHQFIILFSSGIGGTFELK
jgi:hypothetical protein